MNTLEKGAILSSLIGLSGLSIYHFFNTKTKIRDRTNAARVTRDKLLDTGKVRLLYSSMSFLYLYKSEQEDLESLFLLKDLMKFAKPRFVGITLSESEYQKKFENFARSKNFREDMKRVSYYIDTKDEEKLTDFRGFSVRDLHNLYLFDWCNNNKCAVIFGDLDEEDIMKRQKAKKKLEKIKQASDGDIQDLYSDLDPQTVNDYRAENMVVKLMENISPKFSVLPQPLDKTLVALAPAETANIIGERWKKRFMTMYNHRVMDKDEVSDEEELEIIKEQHKTYS